MSFVFPPLDVTKSHSLGVVGVDHHIPRVQIMIVNLKFYVGAINMYKCHF